MIFMPVRQPDLINSILLFSDQVSFCRPQEGSMITLVFLPFQIYGMIKWKLPPYISTDKPKSGKLNIHKSRNFLRNYSNYKK